MPQPQQIREVFPADINLFLIASRQASRRWGHRGKGNGVAQISDLRPEEGVRLDPDRLAALYAEIGRSGAEQVISAAMEQLAVHLAAIQTAAQRRAAADLLRAVDALTRLAGQVGMTSLARVAGDVAGCAARGDPVGQAATLARLVRIGDRSLTAVWDLQDLSL